MNFAGHTFAFEEFLQEIGALVEQRRTKEAVDFFRNNRLWFPDTLELKQLDDVVKQFAGDISLNESIPPFTPFVPGQCFVGRRNYRKKDYRVTAIVSSYKSGEFIRDCLTDLENQTIADQVAGLFLRRPAPRMPSGAPPHVAQRSPRNGGILR